MARRNPVDRPVETTTRFVVPEDIDFSDLHLRRHRDGRIRFDWRVVGRVCEESGVSARELALGPNEDLIAFLVAWYNAQLRLGGAANPVAEALEAEMQVWPSGDDALALPPGHS